VYNKIKEELKNTKKELKNDEANENKSLAEEENTNV
jgi:hypothetical protein